MTLFTRIEFVGKDAEGYTVSGHKFDTSLENVERWLEEQGIHMYIVELGLLPPDPLVLEYDEIAEVWRSFNSYTAFIVVFHEMNSMLTKYIVDIQREDY